MELITIISLALLQTSNLYQSKEHIKDLSLFLVILLANDFPQYLEEFCEGMVFADDTVQMILVYKVEKPVTLQWVTTQPVVYPGFHFGEGLHSGGLQFFTLYLEAFENSR